MTFIDWGCPDGTREDEYGNTENWSDNRWRWEFKRRSDKYRVGYWNLWYQQWRDEGQRGVAPDCPVSDEDKLDHVFYLRISDATDFGMRYLPNPINRNVDEHFLKTAADTLEWRTLRPIHFIKVKRGEMSEHDIFAFGKVAITFDPNSAIKPQIDGLADYLESLRHHSHPDDIRREQKSKWLTYLRILDAREAGMSWAECADAVLPGTNAKTPQSARDAHGRAKLLMDRL